MKQITPEVKREILFYGGMFVVIACLALALNSGLMHLIGNYVVAQDAPTSEEILMSNARNFLGTPYVAGTLEQPGEEHLVINRREVDCTTYVEYVMANALCALPHSHYYGILPNDMVRLIRYRDGVITGYASRLHYITDWIANGVFHEFITDITALHSPHKQRVELSYMTSHPELYPQLRDNPETLRAMRSHEERLSQDSIHWLPEAELPAEGLPWIHNGDIIALTTSIPGLDVTHMGFACYKDGKLHLLHASSRHGKVVLDPVPLRTMLLNSKNWTGIRVLRINL